MEYLVFNFTSNRVRRAKLHGREHIVAPLTLLVPGVLNGSQGPLFYPSDEIAKNYSAWNGMPIVVYHPQLNGSHVSARGPEILDKSQIGRVFNAHTSLNGKLKAEGWFDVADTRRIDRRVLAALESGKPIELSTGLFTDNEPAHNGANFNGKPYDFVARNYVPDHLAILPDQTGACSIRDGCGVLVNFQNQETAMFDKNNILPIPTLGFGETTSTAKYIDEEILPLPKMDFTQEKVEGENKHNVPSDILPLPRMTF